jgi:hypothetical protein
VKAITISIGGPNERMVEMVRGWADQLERGEEPDAVIVGNGGPGLRILFTLEGPDASLADEGWTVPVVDFR